MKIYCEDCEYCYCKNSKKPLCFNDSFEKKERVFFKETPVRRERIDNISYPVYCFDKNKNYDCKGFEKKKDFSAFKRKRDLIVKKALEAKEGKCLRK